MTPDQITQAQLRRQRALVATTLRTVAGYLADAERDIIDQIRTAQSAQDATAVASLRPRLVEVRRIWQEFRERATTTLGARLDEAWVVGTDAVDVPLSTVVASQGAQLADQIPLPDRATLVALQNTTTERIAGLTADAIDDTDAALAAYLIGAADLETTVARVKAVTGLGRQRALTIVRTEVGRALAQASFERLRLWSQRLDGLKKQWHRSSKVNRRPSHDQAHGQIRAIEEPFLVGGERLMFPRDPAASIDNTINCGCLVVPYLADVRVTDTASGREDEAPATAEAPTDGYQRALDAAQAQVEAAAAKAREEAEALQRAGRQLPPEPAILLEPSVPLDTEQAVVDWLADQMRITGDEHGVALDADGRMIAAWTGGEHGRVALPPEVSVLRQQEGADITMWHVQPDHEVPSQQDLNMIGAGVARFGVAGPDGQVTMLEVKRAINDDDGAIMNEVIDMFDKKRIRLPEYMNGEEAALALSIMVTEIGRRRGIYTYDNIKNLEILKNLPNRKYFEGLIENYGSI